MNLEQRFREFIREAEQRGLAIEGIAVADEKKVLLEHRFTPDLPRNIYSHTKSYTATAVGLAVEEGILRLEDRLADFFPEKLPKAPPPALLQITLRCLLTMSSGFGKSYLMSEERRGGEGAPDYMAYMLSRPVTEQPGQRFCYSTADSILAGYMVEKAAGVRLGQYLYERLFSRLGQGYPVWEHDPQGHPNGGGGMFLRLTEMMKLGQLYLAGGRWQGEQVVPAGWVREATRKQIDTGNTGTPGDVWSCGYGYQFWLSPYPGSYRADGAFGQVSTVLPEKGLVVAVQCPETGDFEQVKRLLHEDFLALL